ncbi:hypothetical protein, partial [Metallibacterium sp.]
MLSDARTPFDVARPAGSRTAQRIVQLDRSLPHVLLWCHYGLPPLGFARNAVLRLSQQQLDNAES